MAKKRSAKKKLPAKPKRPKSEKAPPEDTKTKPLDPPPPEGGGGSPGSGNEPDRVIGGEGADVTT